MQFQDFNLKLDFFRVMDIVAYLGLFEFVLRSSTIRNDRRFYESHLLFKTLPEVVNLLNCYF